MDYLNNSEINYGTEDKASEILKKIGVDADG